ncbi:hypothetical protein [Blattabacterium cuenoti]
MIPKKNYNILYVTYNKGSCYPDIETIQVYCIPKNANNVEISLIVS